MKGSTFAAHLPVGKRHELPRRDQMIFDAVRRRDIAPIQWTPITTRYGDYTGKIWVSNDALRVGDASDSIRVNASHETAQKIADELGYVLPSAKISDLIYQQAKVRLLPMPQGKWRDDETMAHTRRMVEASRMVDKVIAGRFGLVSNVGKDWVTTRRLFSKYVPNPKYKCDHGPVRSANYGWHWSGATQRPATPAGGKAVFQSIGLCHSIEHVDYSQVIRLVKRQMQICGKDLGDCHMVDIEQVVREPQYAGLVSHEGPLAVFRHPSVKLGCHGCDPSVVAGDSSGGMCEMGPSNCEPLPLPEPDPTTLGPPPHPENLELDPPIADDYYSSGDDAVVTMATGLAGALAGFLAVSWLMDR